jgi:two-component system sensor histidine kinase PilS (NtrC family)
VAVNAASAPVAQLPSPDQPNWRSLRLLAICRLGLAILLVVLVALGGHVELLDPAGSRDAFVGTAIAFLAFAIGWLALIRLGRPGFELQLSVQAAADLVLLTALMHAAGGARSGFGLLLVAAVGGVAVLSSALRAAFAAAIASILVLGEALLHTSRTGWLDVSQLPPAALIGGACFAMAFLVNRLATRLATQEALASRRGADLNAQLEINRLVISELEDGVVVFDSHGRVRAMNRSAQALLGASGPLPQLVALLERWPGSDAGTADGAIETALECIDEAAPEGVVQRRVRVRLLKPWANTHGNSVLILEDLRTIDERAQQLKLASMGRLSASIAHEIRNPLAAIRHANGLLAERQSDPLGQRLSRIVEDSSVRIDRIVENVLSIARRERPSPEPLDAAAFLDALVAEVTAADGVDPTRIELSVHSQEPIVFDPRHLRQVMTNLMSNALRHGSRRPGALRLEWGRGRGARLELKVCDDGPGLPPEMMEHVFEPFFTTESRGTGLGLFLAREFCSANGAGLRYERIADGGRYSGAFVILPGVA